MSKLDERDEHRAKVRAMVERTRERTLAAIVRTLVEHSTVGAFREYEYVHWMQPSGLLALVDRHSPLGRELMREYDDDDDD